MRHRAHRFASPSTGALLLVLLGCGPPLQMRYEENLEAAPPAAKHAVHSERLRDAMRQLRESSVERLPKEMDVAAADPEHARTVARLARQIAASAEEIPAALDGVVMGEEARADFQTLCNEMRERALALAAAAERHPPEDLESRMQDVDHVCATCHSRYRILPRVP
jgi:cytochrome c556